MRNFFKLALLTTASIGLSSCVFNREEQIKKDYDYEDVSKLQIDWKNAFSLTKTQYFLYFYSKTCGHCEQIKNSIIEYALSSIDDFYFVEYVEEIPLTTNIELTIGAESWDDFAIRGTPSLAKIENKKVVCNLCGTNDILSFLNLSN